MTTEHAIDEAAALVRENGSRYAADPIVVHLVALGILHGERKGMDDAMTTLREAAISALEGIRP